jgi:MHS family proline/betaine transporter-like MFS transporter
MINDATANSAVGDSAREERPLSPKRAAIISGMGSAVEYYDFVIYGLMATYLGSRFFPSQSSLAGLLATLGIFGSAFIVRPLGGIVFGWIGDKYGRSSTLVVTVLGMGVSSVLMAVLPTFDMVGMLAPVLLLICRMAQGFFAGGEVSGASTYISECAPLKHRGLYGSLNPTGVTVGLAAAPAVAGIVSTMLNHQQMLDWGWRVPFALCGPLILVTAYARLHLEDSPQFRRTLERQKKTKTPLKVLLAEHRKPLLKAIGISTAQNAMAYIGLLYFNIYLTRTLGYPGHLVYWLMALAPFFSGTLMPLFGALSDRIGRKPVMLAGYGSYIVILPVSMMLMQWHSLSLACIGALLAFVPYAMVQAVGYPLYAELYPTSVRYSGVALGINLGALIGGASIPSLSTWLTAATGNRLSAAYLGMLAGLLAVAVILTVKETAYEALED